MISIPRNVLHCMDSRQCVEYFYSFKNNIGSNINLVLHLQGHSQQLPQDMRTEITFILHCRAWRAALRCGRFSRVTQGGGYQQQVATNNKLFPPRNAGDGGDACSQHVRTLTFPLSTRGGGGDRMWVCSLPNSPKPTCGSPRSCTRTGYGTAGPGRSSS